MDDNSDFPHAQTPGRPEVKSRTRSSLVERAAEKVAADHSARSRQEAPRPAYSAPPQELLPVEALPGMQENVTPPDLSAELAAGGSNDPAEVIGEAAEAPIASQRPPAGGAGPRANNRTSKSVKIDWQALMARNILTPMTKRNRSVEEFRLIKRKILSRRWDESDAPGNTVLVTSALPSEGKTTTAINLAMSIAAEEDLRVLLVDADFIKPDALRQLGVRAEKGLIDVIQDPRMDISDVILKTDIEKLSLIPSGRLHDRCTELLASARMDVLVAELANRYEDRVLIFDSPPILATTESVVLASHMGQIVFVVQSERTKRESVQSALDLIGYRENIGMVLNRTKSRLGSTEFGSYYGADYYHYGHGN